MIEFFKTSNLDQESNEEIKTFREQSNEWRLYVPIFVPENKKFQNILNIKMQWSGIKDVELESIIVSRPFHLIKTESELKEENNRIQEIEGIPLQIKPKNKRLTDRLKLQILTMSYKKRMNKPEISKSLHIPYSSVARIIREYEKEPSKTQTWFNSKHAHISKWQRAEESLKEYVWSNSTVFTSVDVQKYVKDVHDLNISQKETVQYMKNQLGLCFRRVSGRPFQAGLSRNKCFKTLFWLEFENLWSGGQVFVNIDEVIFSNSTKHNYSWIKKGGINTLLNINFRGSLSIIGSITSTGEMFFSSMKTTNNSQVFNEYITKLMLWLWDDLRLEKDKIILIMDNSPIHWSKIWLKHLDDFGWQVVFLAPYCPQFAPIELLFHLLKVKVWKHSKNEVTNLSKADGDRWIKECLSTITKDEIVRMWRHSTSKIAQEINLQRK